MIKNDYVKRVEEQILVVISRLEELKKNNLYNESLKVIDEAMKKLSGISSATVDSMSYKDILNLISLDHEASTIKCLVISELLKEQANIYETHGENAEAYARNVKSLNMYVETMLKDEDAFNENSDRDVKEIIRRVAEYQLPLETNILLFKYYEAGGSYAKAEDTLYEVMDSCDFKQEAVEFYERLMEKSDQELLQGNLSKEEVKEALEELKQ